MDYPYSIVEYFLVGMTGAATFLFLLLMFDKRIKILENETLGQRSMVVIYIALGGALSAIVNLSANPTFGVAQFTIAFTAGIGWPAIAAGFSAGKKIGDADEETAKAEETAKNLEAMKDSRENEMETFYKNNREQILKGVDVLRQAFEKEVDEVKAFYEQKIASMTQ